MHPRTKWLVGGAIILGGAGVLMANAITKTGEYYLTPQELATKVSRDPSFVETGVKVGARVVPGSIVRTPGGREVNFKVSDGGQTYPVIYRGITPDTFTDGVDVVVEGRLGHDGNCVARDHGDFDRLAAKAAAGGSGGRRISCLEEGANGTPAFACGLPRP